MVPVKTSDPPVAGSMQVTVTVYWPMLGLCQVRVPVSLVTAWISLRNSFLRTQLKLEYLSTMSPDRRTIR